MTTGADGVAGDWADINGCIREALAGPDPVGDLTRLFEETDDGNVALQFGYHLLRSGNPCDAIEWFDRAEQRLPLANFKRKAADGRARARTACGEEPPPPRPPAGTLHVVCCTKGKIWRDDPTADRRVPAGRAYTGRTFGMWRASREAADGAPWIILSAKYGFLDPDQPIEDYDVTFRQPVTHPIGDAPLRRQAASIWRAFERPLTTFGSVRVLGSETYVDRVRAAFAGTGVTVTRWEPSVADAHARHPPPASPPIADLGAALAALPDAVFERADQMLPEWPVLGTFARLRSDLGALAALGVALNNYNLGRGGADAYWALAQRIIGRADPADVQMLHRCLETLLTLPVAAPDAVDRLRKHGRLRRLFESPIPRLLRRDRRPATERLWRELSTAPGPSRDAKTVVYAMRTYALLHRRTTDGRLDLPAEMPLPVDVRITQLALASGLIGTPQVGVVSAIERDARRIASERRAEIASRWGEVARRAGRTAMALDAVLWPAAKRMYDTRTDRSAAAAGVGDLLIALGAGEVAASRAAVALTAALHTRR